MTLSKKICDSYEQHLKGDRNDGIRENTNYSHGLIAVSTVLFLTETPELVVDFPKQSELWLLQKLEKNQQDNTFEKGNQACQ